MSTRLFRILASIAGIIGVVALGYYYSVPFPLPPITASVTQVMAFGTQYQNTVLADTWLQAMGAILTVVFFLSLVFQAGAHTRFAGWITLLASALILTTALAEGTFAIGAVEAGINGQGATAVTCLVLTYVFVHIFLILPAPLLFLGLGAVLLTSPLLPRVFGWLALILGIAFIIVGCGGLFNTTITIIGIFLQIGQELWVLGTAITLLILLRKQAQSQADTLIVQQF